MGGPSGAAAVPPDETILIGHSRQGRILVARRFGDATSAVRVMVVGAVHGNEAAGVDVARRLRGLGAPEGVAIWVIDDANPDGSRARRRQNAAGVDLNRNFPMAWRPLGPRGSVHYAGPSALSEPESRAVASLARRVRPTLSIWFHQALAVVDLSGGRTTLSRRYAAWVGLRAARLGRFPGSATAWQNRTFAGSTAFVVELPSGRLSRRSAERHARAVRRLARSVLVAGPTGRGRPPG